MADLALVFHWPPDTLSGMSLADLAMWREEARKRHEADHDG